MNSNKETFALRLYRSLLFAYPAEVRREYAREMVFVFQHRWAEERGFGALLLWLQVVTDVFTAALREHLAQVAADIRYTVRVLRSNPGFAVVSVLVLALGISASATAFTVLNATLIRPLPYPEADRLLFIDHIPKKEARHLPFSTHEFFALKRAQTLAEVGAFQEFELTLRGDFEPQRIRATYVAGRLLPLLEVKPILGRLFTDEEDRPGAPKVILLSHALWLRRYGADPAIIGRQVRCGSDSPTVIGVMPPGFLFPSESHLWLPAAVDPAAEKPTTLFLSVIGRMRPGVSVAQARAEIARVIEGIQSGPSNVEPAAARKRRGTAVAINKWSEGSCVRVDGGRSDWSY